MTSVTGGGREPALGGTDTKLAASPLEASRPRALPGDFQIVPLRGLPIVAVVLAGLVATIATNKLWAIDFYHVVGGGIWTALDLFLGFVLGPILGRLSIPARSEFTARFMPKMVLIMPTLVVCTLRGGVAARSPSRLHRRELLAPRLGCGLVHRGGGDGGGRPRRARARQHRSPLRAEEARA